MIRNAIIGDFNEINNIASQYKPDFAKTFFISEELKKEFSIILVCADNKVKGFLYAIDVGNNIDLLFIVVDRNYRCQHIASDLLNYLIRKYAKNKTVTLEVAVTNKEALKLYEKFGFVQVNLRKNYYANGDDAIVMRREE